MLGLTFCGFSYPVPFRVRVCVGMHKQVVLSTYRGLARSCVLPVTLLLFSYFIFPGCEEDSLLFNTDASGESVMRFTLSANFFQS